MPCYTKMNQENPDKYPGRMGQPWKPEEVDKLLTSIREKKSLEDIAKDHQRTEGGINAELRKLAYEYHIKSKKQMEEISVLTGLSEKDIRDTITRRDAIQEKKQSLKGEYDTNKLIPEKTPTKIEPTPPDLTKQIAHLTSEMAEMKKDIKELLACMKAAYEFEDA